MQGSRRLMGSYGGAARLYWRAIWSACRDASHARVNANSGFQLEAPARLEPWDHLAMDRLDDETCTRCHGGDVQSSREKMAACAHHRVSWRPLTHGFSLHSGIWSTSIAVDHMGKDLTPHDWPKEWGSPRGGEHAGTARHCIAWVCSDHGHRSPVGRVRRLHAGRGRISTPDDRDWQRRAVRRQSTIA